MKKKATVLIILLLAGLLLGACSSGTKVLAPEEYAIYEDNKKIGVLGEDGMSSSVSFKSLQRYNFMDKKLSTKQNLKIGSSIDDLLMAYKGQYIMVEILNLASDSETLFDECYTIDSFVGKYNTSDVTGEYSIDLYTIVLVNNKTVSLNGWEKYAKKII